MPTALSARLKQEKLNGTSRTYRRRGTKSVRYGRGKIAAAKNKKR